MWTTLAGLAAVTSRITLGPLVAATAFHAPAMLAKMAGTVDEISGGRLVLGLGAGWNETEFSAFGFPFDRRVSRFAEAFTIIRTLLREGAIDFAGEFFTARDCELCRPPARRASAHDRLDGSADAGDRGAIRRFLECLVRGLRQPAGGNRPAPGAGGRRRPGRRARPRRDRADGGGPRPPARRRGPPDGRHVAGGGAADQRHGRGDRGDAPGVRRAGISHVQLVVDPITVPSIEALAPVLAALDRG